MTRMAVYATGHVSNDEYSSGLINKRELQYLREKYQSINDNELAQNTEAIIQRELETVKEHHENLIAKVTKSGVSIGYRGVEGGFMEVWGDTFDDFCTAKFDVTLSRRIRHTPFDSYEELADNELRDEDKELFLEWVESNQCSS